MNKTLSILVFAIVLIAALALVVRQQSNTSPVRIGVLLPLTGGLASYGEPAQKMMEMAASDINVSGATKVELNIQDHTCNPKTALSEFEQLSTTEHVHLFASVACSGTALAIAPKLATNKAVLVGTITTTPKLTGVSPYFFRNWASDRSEAELFAKEMIARNVHSVAVLYEETDYAKGLKVALEEMLAPQGVTVTGESFTTGATDVRTQLTKLRAIHADAFFFSPQTVTSGDIALGQMQALGWKPALFLVNDNVLKSVELRTKYTALLEGVLGADFVMTPSDEGKAVLTRYKAKYGSDCSPQNICLGAYDAIRLLAQAASKTDGSADAVRAYMSTAPYAGISGPISFDANNDRVNTAHTLFVIKNGEAVSAQ